MAFRTVPIPLEVYIKKGAIENVHKVVEKFGSRNLVLLTDDVVYKIVGGKLETELAKYYSITRFFVNRASMDEAKRIVMEISFSDVELVIGLGGGKVIDVSKVVSTELNIPFISIPTTASHDGIASPVASFKENGKPISITTNPPAAVIADIEIIKSAPIRLLRSGYGDLISNITAVKDWQLARDKIGESYSEVAASIAVIPAELMISEAKNFDLLDDTYITKLVRGLIMSGVSISIVGSSRPASGAEHKFSHSIDYLGYGNGLHGEQVGIGTIIMEYFYEKAYGNGDFCLIRDSLRRIGAPTAAAEIGLTKEQVIEALMYAKKIRRKRYTILEDLNPTKAEFEKAVEETKVA